MRKPAELIERMGGPKGTRWTKAAVLEAASKCESRIAFSRGYPGAFKAASRLGVLDEIFSPPAERTWWSEELVRIEAAKYRNRSELHRNSGSAYAYANLHGLLDSLFGEKVEWTEEAILKEYSGFADLKGFREACPGAYDAACRKGLTASMLKRRLPRYSEVEVRALAAECSTKSEFNSRYVGAYHVALKGGYINSLGFSNQNYGYDSSKPGYIYIADIRLLDNTDGVLIGITGNHPHTRYIHKGLKFMREGHAYMFSDGTVPMEIERQIKRLFLAKKITGNQSPITGKLGTSGEIISGVPRSVVEIALLDLAYGYDWMEEW